MHFGIAYITSTTCISNTVLYKQNGPLSLLTSHACVVPARAQIQAGPGIKLALRLTNLKAVRSDLVSLRLEESPQQVVFNTKANRAFCHTIKGLCQAIKEVCHAAVM
jgi:hypothetical protein